MERIEVQLRGLLVEAWLCDETQVVPLGVDVQFHPGVPEFVRRMTLESVLRQWQRETGSVTRGAAANATARGLWLKGWTLQAFQQGTVIGMRIAFRHSDEGDTECETTPRSIEA